MSAPTKKPRQRPLKVTYALVPYTLYPHVVRSIFNDIQSAIFVWAAVSHKAGKMLTAGFMARETGFAVTVCSRIFEALLPTRMVGVVYPSSHPESVLYEVKEHICFAADRRDKAVVYTLRNRKGAVVPRRICRDRLLTLPPSAAVPSARIDQVCATVQWYPDEQQRHTASQASPT